MAKMNFGGVVENVVTRDEFTIEKAREVLKNEVVAVIGYGVQGPGQSLNLKDNGINVIVGQRPGKTYDKAVADGWVPGKTLFIFKSPQGFQTLLHEPLRTSRFTLSAQHTPVQRSVDHSPAGR